MLKVWRQFIDACRTHQAHEYTFNELGLSSMYAEPGRELEYREYAESSTDPFTVSSLLTVSTSSGSNHQFGCSTCGPNGTQCYWTPSDYRGETRMAGHQSGTSNGRAAGRRVGDPRPLDSISQAIYTADGIVMGTWAPVGQPRIPAQIQRDHVGHF